MPQPSPDLLEAAFTRAKANTFSMCALQVRMLSPETGRWSPIELLAKDAHSLAAIAAELIATGSHDIIELVSPDGVLIHTWKNDEAKATMGRK